MHAVQVPARGGETRFADMYRAYETLPEAMRRRIDDLTVCHHYGNRDDPEGKTRHAAARLREDQKAAVRPVTHPLVRSHPVTGRKALYAVAGTSHGIVGMADDAATLHAATLIDPATGPHDTRMLYRLSIKGAPELFTRL